MIYHLKRLGGLAHAWGFFSGLDFFSYYRPVGFVSFAADASVWGWHAGGFHVTNLVLHCVNVLLVFALARRLVTPSVAGLAAALFAAHASNQEAVYWISARFDLLATCGVLATVLLATKRQAWCVAAAMADFRAGPPLEGGGAGRADPGRRLRGVHQSFTRPARGRDPRPDARADRRLLARALRGRRARPDRRRKPSAEGCGPPGRRGVVDAARAHRLGAGGRHRGETPASDGRRRRDPACGRGCRRLPGGRRRDALPREAVVRRVRRLLPLLADRRACRTAVLPRSRDVRLLAWRSARSRHSRESLPSPDARVCSPTAPGCSSSSRPPARCCRYRASRRGSGISTWGRSLSRSGSRKPWARPPAAGAARP